MCAQCNFYPFAVLICGKIHNFMHVLPTTTTSITTVTQVKNIKIKLCDQSKESKKRVVLGYYYTYGFNSFENIIISPSGSGAIPKIFSEKFRILCS